MSEPTEEEVEVCTCGEKMTTARALSTVFFFSTLFFIEGLALWFLWDNALADLFHGPKISYFQVCTIFLAFKLLFSRIKF